MTGKRFGFFWKVQYIRLNNTEVPENQTRVYLTSAKRHHSFKFDGCGVVLSMHSVLILTRPADVNVGIFPNSIIHPMWHGLCYCNATAEVTAGLNAASLCGSKPAEKLRILCALNQISKHFLDVILCAVYLVKVGCSDKSAFHFRVTLVPSSGQGVNNKKTHRDQAARCAVYPIILLLIQSQDTISTSMVWKERTGT